MGNDVRGENSTTEQSRTSGDSRTEVAGTPHGNTAADAAAHLERSGASVEDLGRISQEIDKQAACLIAWATGQGLLLPASYFGANGYNFRNMPVKDYRTDLLRRLKDSEYAAQYLARVLAEKDRYAFLIAIRDVVEASGGMGTVAKKVGVKPPSLYKALSKSGNPTLETLQAILDSLGLRITIAAA